MKVVFNEAIPWIYPYGASIKVVDKKVLEVSTDFSY